MEKSDQRRNTPYILTEQFLFARRKKVRQLINRTTVSAMQNTVTAQDRADCVSN